MEKLRRVGIPEGASGLTSPMKNDAGPILTEGHWREGLAALLSEARADGGIIIAGIGHPFRSDDFVGSLVARDLARKTKPTGHLRIVDLEDSPENLTHALGQAPPALLILIDSLDAGAAPGSICLVDLSATSDSFFTTHNIPLELILRASPKCPRTILLGVQPKSLDVGDQLSEEVQFTRERIVDELLTMVNGVESSA